MAELKTKPNDASVEAFINGVENEQKRSDSFAILEMMKKLSGAEPIMWGGSIIGLGKYTYKYASGKEGEWMKIGFSPRKQNISLYLMCGLESFKDELPELGKHKTGKGCLYINKLSDVDLSVLEKMIQITLKKLK